MIGAWVLLRWKAEVASKLSKPTRRTGHPSRKDYSEISSWNRLTAAKRSVLDQSSKLLRRSNVKTSGGLRLCRINSKGDEQLVVKWMNTGTRDGLHRSDIWEDPRGWTSVSWYWEKMCKRICIYGHKMNSIYNVCVHQKRNSDRSFKIKHAHF